MPSEVASVSMPQDPDIEVAAESVHMVCLQECHSNQASQARGGRRRPNSRGCPVKSVVLDTTMKGEETE